MNTTVESSQSPESLFGVPRSRTPPNTTSFCSLRDKAPQISPVLQESVAIAATVSPETSSKSEMIDYAELSPSQAVVSSNPVQFYLVLARNYSKKNMLPAALEFYSRALRIENKAAPTSTHSSSTSGLRSPRCWRRTPSTSSRRAGTA